MVDEQLRSDNVLSIHHINLLPLTITSLAGQEERRQQHLNDPAKKDSVAEAMMRLWARTVSRGITARLTHTHQDGRPVIVLRELPALHTVGNTTAVIALAAGH